MSYEKNSADLDYSWSEKQPERLLMTATSQQQDLVALSDCRVFPLSASQCLLRSKRTGAEVAVGLDVLNTLQLCREFRSLDDHVHHITSLVPALADQAAEVRRILDSLATQGFMTSAMDIVRELSIPAVPFAAGALHSVTVRTCERPEQLRRLLNSFLDNEKRFKNHYRYVILDDSKSSEQQHQNSQSVAEFAAQGLNAAYYGQTAQQQFTENLCQQFPQHAPTIQWLLNAAPGCGAATYGRTWNHALLLNAGERFVMFDDDALPMAYKSPHHTSAVEISGRERQVNFYPDRDELLKRNQIADIDPIAQHQEILGATLTQALGHFSGGTLTQASVSHLQPHEIPRVAKASPVLLTVAGSFGDPGINSLRSLFDLDKDSWQRFVSSEADYLHNSSSRTLWCGHPGLHFATSKYLMTTTATGLDNRRLLPPTAPEFVNEDALFGAAAQYLYPDMLMLEFSWGLLHLPEPPRRWDRDTLDTAVRPNVLGYLADLALRDAPRCLAGHAPQRLHSLATLYLDIADADESTFKTALQEHWLSMRTDLIRRLHNRLQEHPDAPDYWIKDVQRILTANGISTPSDDVNPSDRAELSAGRLGSEGMRDVLQRYGSALNVWPELWEYCRENKSIANL
jgi:hypothetical protein